MIKNIIFDMGQVLIQWSPKLLTDRLDCSEADKQLLISEVFGGVEWTALDRGRLSPDEGCRAICRRLPERLHEAAERLIRYWWQDELIPVDGMRELIYELHSKGYSIYLLSNAASTLNIYFDRLPGAQYFLGKIVSADVKLLKPQHEIYELMYKRFSLKPEECLFIDDSPANIDGAECTGMSGIVFRGDLQRLRNELFEAGIKVKK